MSVIALLALDVDGTLVGSEGIVSARLGRALAECLARGMHICLVTGRPLLATLPMVRELGLPTPPAVFGGSLVPALDGGAPWYSRPLSRDVLPALIAEARAHDDYLEIHTADQLYVERDGPEAEYQTGKLRVAPCIGSFDALPADEPILKAQYVLRTAEQDARIRALGEHLRDRVELSWNVSPGFGGHFVNINAPGVHKVSAIEALLARLGFDWGQVLAAGDSPGDLPMVQRAAVGLLMGNAPAALHSQARWVMPSVEEDGLAQGIERFVLDGDGA